MPLLDETYWKILVMLKKITSKSYFLWLCIILLFTVKLLANFLKGLLTFVYRWRNSLKRNQVCQKKEIEERAIQESLSSAVVFASSSSSWSLEHRPFRPFEEHYPSDYCNFIVLFLRRPGLFPRFSITLWLMRSTHLILALGYAWRIFPPFGGKVFCGKSFGSTIVFPFDAPKMAGNLAKCDTILWLTLSHHLGLPIGGCTTKLLAGSQVQVH